MKFTQHQSYGIRFFLLTMLLSLAITHPVAAMQALSDKLEVAFEEAASWKSGDSPQPLRVIRNAVWQAKKPGLSVIEQSLIELLDDSGATFDSRNFAAEMLSLVGSENTVDAIIRIIDSGAFAERKNETPLYANNLYLPLQMIKNEDSRAHSLEHQLSFIVSDSRHFWDEIRVHPSSYIDNFLSKVIKMINDGMFPNSMDGSLPIRILGQRGAQPQLEAIREDLTAPDQPAAIRVATYLALADATRGNQLNERNSFILEALEAAASKNQFMKVFESIKSANHPALLPPLAYQLDKEYHGREAALTALQLIPLAEPDTAKNMLKIIQRELADDQDVMTQVTTTRNQLERNEDFILNWQFAGPFFDETIKADALLAQKFKPESRGIASEVEWQSVPADAIRKPGRVNLKNLIGGNDRVAYLRATIISDQSQPARLEIGSDDGCKIWLNGKLIHTANVMRGLSYADDIINIDLNAGENRLLLKVLQGSGDWEAAIRLRDRDSQHLPGVRY